ncbi:unnamed protein product, partial [Ectocarpus sp. 12 AP-2014]
CHVTVRREPHPPRVCRRCRCHLTLCKRPAPSRRDRRFLLLSATHTGERRAPRRGCNEDGRHRGSRPGGGGNVVAALRVRRPFRATAAASAAPPALASPPGTVSISAPGGPPVTPGATREATCRAGWCRRRRRGEWRPRSGVLDRAIAVAN